MMIQQAIDRADERQAIEWTKAALEGQATWRQIVQDAFTPAADHVYGQLLDGQCYVPDLFACARAQRASLDILGRRHDFHPPVVITGVMDSRCRTIDRYLADFLLRSRGYRLVDLCAALGVAECLAAMEESRAQVLCLWARWPATLARVEELARRLEQRGIRNCVSIVVGLEDGFPWRPDSSLVDAYVSDPREMVTAVSTLRPASA